MDGVDVSTRSDGSNFSMPSKVDRYRCKICDMNFVNNAAVLVHARTVHARRPLDEVVAVPMVTEVDRRPHDEEVTESGNDKAVEGEIYLCSSCGDVFMDEASMEEHCQLVHDGVTLSRIFECAACHKRYETQSSFDDHDCAEPESQIPRSNQVMPILMNEAENENLSKSAGKMCEICAIAFVSKYALNRHRELVHGVKEMGVKDTPRAHNRRGKTRKSWSRSANEDGLFDCGRCQASFPSLLALKNHAVQVHQMKWSNVRQRKPQVCSVCNKEFSSMGNMNKHKKIVHGHRSDEAMFDVSTMNIVVECRDVDVTEFSKPTSSVTEENDGDDTGSVDSPSTPDENSATVECVAENDDACEEMVVEVETIQPNSNSVVTLDQVAASTIQIPEQAVSESMEEVVIQDGGIIQVSPQTMAVQSADLGGYILEMNENLYNELNMGEVHMIIEDTTDKENTAKDASDTLSESVKDEKGRAWYCSLCTRFFSEKNELLVHYRESHIIPDQSEPDTGSPQQCPICLRIFSTKGNRDKHVKTVHMMPALISVKEAEAEIRIACNYCLKTFRHRNALNKHVRIAHPERHNKRRVLKLNKDATEEERTCQICLKVFPDLLKKEVHVNNHSRNDREFRCDICEKTFKRSDYFKEHYEKNHGVPRFKCSFCPKRFVRRSYQLIHERVHTQERPYACNICPKRFKQWGGLHQHKRFHSPKPPATHFCSKCHRCYSYKSDLDRHMVIHSDRKHVCEYCSKPFPTASQLTVHIRTHTGQRPYKCTRCCMCFMTMGGLKRHSQIHERREQGGFMCAICGVSYRREASVDEHIRVFHADRVEEPIEVQSVDLIQECADNRGEEITVQVTEHGLQVLTRGENTWVDTTDIEKELVEGILASQAGDNLIVVQEPETS